MADFIIDMINYLIDGLGTVISTILSIFPDTPFGSPSTPPDSINLGWITWIFDFPTWILHFTLILVAIGFYYVIRVAARWIKLVRE